MKRKMIVWSVMFAALAVFAASPAMAEWKFSRIAELKNSEQYRLRIDCKVAGPASIQFFLPEAVKGNFSKKLPAFAIDGKPFKAADKFEKAETDKEKVRWARWTVGKDAASISQVLNEFAAGREAAFTFTLADGSTKEAKFDLNEMKNVVQELLRPVKGIEKKAEQKKKKAK